MPFRPDLLKSLREAKGLSQEQLSENAGLSQSVIAKTERGKNMPGSEVLEKLAQALDCTSDYLLGRGPVYQTPAVAAARMAFDVFIIQDGATEEQRDRCGRALRHPDAPKTAQAWRSLAEMLELAMGQKSSSSPLALVQRQPRSKPMTVSRRPHS